MTGMYAVDVTLSSHELLKQGITEAVWYRVLISADEVSSDVEATLVAAQMASCHGMCTSAELVSWPTT